MHFLRKGAAWLLIVILPLILIALAVTFAISRATGNPEHVKSILRDSGLYGSAVDGILEATNNPNREEPGGITADNPVAVSAIKNAFPPELLQSSAENFIDGYYNWLEGTSSTPDFRIDLTEAKAKFVNEIAAGAQSRAASLPVCPRGQTQFEDPFAATCLPRGMSPTVAADIIRQELAGGQEKFLKDPVITADTFKGKDGQPAFSSSSELPENYQRIKKMPVVLGIITLLILAAIIFLTESRRTGLKRVGVSLLIVGGMILLMTWLTSKIVNNQIVPKIDVKNSVLEKNLRTLAGDISGTVSRNFLLVGGTYATLGALAIGGVMVINKRHLGKTTTPTDSIEAKSPKSKSASKPTK